MANFELISSIARQTSSKIVFLVVDGLGGLRHDEIGMTELEAASTPNLDRLARTGTTGLTIHFKARPKFQKLSHPRMFVR